MISVALELDHLGGKRHRVWLIVYLKHLLCRDEVFGVAVQVLDNDVFVIQFVRNRQPLVAKRQEKGCCSLQNVAELYHIRDAGPFGAIMSENPIPDMQVLLPSDDKLKLLVEYCDIRICVEVIVHVFMPDDKLWLADCQIGAINYRVYSVVIIAVVCLPHNDEGVILKRVHFRVLTYETRVCLIG